MFIMSHLLSDTAPTCTIDVNHIISSIRGLSLILVVCSIDFNGPFLFAMIVKTDRFVRLSFTLTNDTHRISALEACKSDSSKNYDTDHLK